MGCSFFTEKDNIGLLCFTNIVIGIISGVGLMFLRKYRHITDKYKSVQRSTAINDEYAGVSPENSIQHNYLSRSTRLIGRDRQRNLRCQEPVYINRRDEYLDPKFQGDSNYLNLIHCNNDQSDLNREQKGHYTNAYTNNRQGNQDLLDDYLEPRKKSCI